MRYKAGKRPPPHLPESLDPRELKRPWKILSRPLPGPLPGLLCHVKMASQRYPPLSQHRPASLSLPCLLSMADGPHSLSLSLFLPLFLSEASPCHCLPKLGPTWQHRHLRGWVCFGGRSGDGECCRGAVLGRETHLGCSLAHNSPRHWLV